MTLDKKTQSTISEYVKLKPYNMDGYDRRRKLGTILSKHPKLDEVKRTIQKLSPERSIKQQFQIDMYGNA